MKKFLVFIALFNMFMLRSNADTTSNVFAFFDKFVNLSNEYNLEVLKMYSNNPVIKRRVLKKEPVLVVVPFAELVKMQQAFNKYKKHLKNTKNFYNNRKITNLGNETYKISAQRCPTVMNGCFNSYMIIKKENGEFKIIEEYSDVKSTYFLKYRDK